MVKLLKILHEKLLISFIIFIFKGKALKIMLSIMKSNLGYIVKLYIKEKRFGEKQLSVVCYHGNLCYVSIARQA